MSGVAAEALGYAASALIAVSLMMTSVLRLRVVNLIGSVAFLVYGVLIGAVPVVVANVVIVVVNLVFLRRLLFVSEAFGVLAVPHDSPVLLRFMDRYSSDMATFFDPHEPSPGDLCLLVFDDLMPVGLFVGSDDGAARMRVEIDYATPGYRDLGLGRFFYRDRAEELSARGYHSLISDPGTGAHRRYLEHMGFIPEGDQLVRDLIL
ncbi:MAG TPA: hypothetical protein VIY70_01610 [Acidimicrobiia bacterium]